MPLVAMAVDFRILLLFLLSLLTLLFFLRTRTQNLPPSPPFSLPLIGHLYLLSHPVRHSLHRLSRSLGPVFSLRFGSRLVVVISSAAAAEECFSQNDVALANRPQLLAGGIVAYNFSTIINVPYGPRWRSLRKTCSAQIFSPLRLTSLSQIRTDAVADLVRKIFSRHNSNSSVVVLRPLLREMMFEIMMRIMAGEKGDLGHVMEVIDEVLKHAETANPANFVAALRWVDFGGYQKRLRKIAGKSDALLQGILDQRRKNGNHGGREENMIDNLLELQKSEPDLYDDDTIKGLVLVILTAGTDTSAVNIEWAMSVLLNHPAIFSKAKNEIDLQVGQSRLVEESDLLKLSYLQNIISETLRMYPPTPLLVPHFASQDCTVGSYRIPRNAMVLVNAWAIHKDPNAWDDPSEFRPERFEGRDVNGYNFMPFGVGRRACPGAGLSSLVVGLALASLIQCFEWERCGDEEVDMTGGDGLTMPKAKSLEAICKARPVVRSVYV